MAPMQAQAMHLILMTYLGCFVLQHQMTDCKAAQNPHQDFCLPVNQPLDESSL